MAQMKAGGRARHAATPASQAAGPSAIPEALPFKRRAIKGPGIRTGAFRTPSVLNRAIVARIAVILAATLFVAGCTTLGDVLVVDDTGAVPRLANGEMPRRGPVVNVAKLNALGAQQTARSFTAYVGKEKVDFPGDVRTIERDIGDIRTATQQAGFEPTAEVSIDFRNATIDEVLRRLLGGALGLNYLASDNLGGTVNFRTETPLPKARVLDVVRDILSRNNLVLRPLNGVYHIATPEEIQVLETNSATGARGEAPQRIVKLAKGNAAEVIALATRMLPANVTLLATSARNAVILQAGPGEADAAERLIRMLSSVATGERSVAILPLSQGEPQAVARKLQEFYAGTLRGPDPLVTVIPLEAQRSLLVGTPDAAMMEDVSILVRQLDQSVSDVQALRIIPLTHLRAQEIAPQLAQSFGATAGAGAAPAADPRRGIDQRAGSRLFPRNRPTPPVEDNEDGANLTVPPPSTIIAMPQGQTDRQGNAQGNGQQDNQNPGAQTPSTAAGAASAGQGQAQGEVRIVADTRNNTLLVHSDYRTFSRMRDVVAALDVPQSQAVIEATVIEVELTNAISQGVAFYLQGRGFAIGSGVPDSQGPGEGGLVGFSGQIGDFSASAVLRALQDVTTVKVVSSPYLTVMNGQPARLVIGDQIPFATASQSSNNGGNVTVTREVEILDTGIVMEITPMIHADNSVSLTISQSVSTPIATTSGDALTPTISTRDIQSQILVQSGRTILLGGLIQDRIATQATQVPKIVNVPLIGDLFRQKGAQAQRTELVVLITPRVSRAPGEIDAITKQLQSFMAGNPQPNYPPPPPSNKNVYKD